MTSMIGPCDDDFRGRTFEEHCRGCGHALAVHRADQVCSVCEATDVLITVHGTLIAELSRDVQQMKERLDRAEIL